MHPCPSPPRPSSTSLPLPAPRPPSALLDRCAPLRSHAVTLSPSTFPIKSLTKFREHLLQNPRAIFMDLQPIPEWDRPRHMVEWQEHITDDLKEVMLCPVRPKALADRVGPVWKAWCWDVLSRPFVEWLLLDSALQVCMAGPQGQDRICHWRPPGHT